VECEARSWGSRDESRLICDSVARAKWEIMLDHELMKSVAQQMMSDERIRRRTGDAGQAHQLPAAENRDLQDEWTRVSGDRAECDEAEPMGRAGTARA